MHGKNFCGATWDATIAVLVEAGYRVVVPDQVGFCASTKPEHYQYSFQQLATNTAALLDCLGVAYAIVVGHSTGGTLATRYALLHPDTVDRLVLVNPIGLEDWKALGVPARTVDQWNARQAGDRPHHAWEAGRVRYAVRPTERNLHRYAWNRTACLEDSSIVGTTVAWSGDKA